MHKASCLLLIVACIIGCSSAGNRSAEKQIPAATHPAVAKKGICTITVRQNKDVWKQRVAALNPGWHYSWGPTIPEPEPQGVQFVPMIWSNHGIDDKFTDLIARLTAQASEGSIHCLLGFNEPDGKNQANMTVDEALTAWPYLMKTGLRLGSPGAVHADKQWMRDFMAQAQARNYRVDFVCVHSYGGINADAFIEHMKKIHELYGKPIWITEFAVADWKAKTRADNRYTPQQVLAFMRKVLPALDKLDFVERYAWFPSGEDSAPLGPSALFHKDGSLTDLGKFYAEYKSAKSQ